MKSPGGKRSPTATAAALAAAAALLATPPAARAEILEEIVAKVNNSIVTRTQFQERMDLYRQQISRKYSGDELDEKVTASQDSLLHNMIIESLLIQRADVLLDMEKVKKNLLEDFKKQQKIETDEELDRLLKEQKMSRQDLLDTLVRLSIPQEIINYEVRRKISVSDKEIQDYYDAHRQDYVKAQRITLREIVILFEEPTREEAKARAEGVHRELEAGADFETLVARESQASSKDQGGLVGPFLKGELLPEVEKAAWTLPVGSIAGPVESAHAFHLVKVESREEEKVTPVAEARDSITEHVRDEKFKDKLEEYLKKLWEDNFIYVFPKYGTSDWKPVGATEKGLSDEP